MEVFMNYARAIGEGILFSVLLVLIQKKNKKWEIPAYAAGIFFGIMSVWVLYRAQENSAYFFWHPYISWMIVNLTDFFVNQKSAKEKLILWPVVILPVFSGFELAVGWLLKLYVKSY